MAFSINGEVYILTYTKNSRVYDKPFINMTFFVDTPSTFNRRWGIPIMFLLYFDVFARHTTTTQKSKIQ